MIGFILGATLMMAVLALLWRLLFKRFLSGFPEAIVSVLAAFVTATILYGFGSADGGEPDFTAGFEPYGIGGVIVFALWSIGIIRARKSANG